MPEPATEMRRARLFPVSGIGSDLEAETRATSALLAVLTVVRDLSTELFSPLGASRAGAASVEAFTEIIAECNGRKMRPDGLIRIAYRKSLWQAYVEVKTGDNRLGADQINDYWDLARAKKVDYVITISNEIAPQPGAHPTAGLRVRANSPVQVAHISWTRILTTAVKLREHKGVGDPEQAFILQELIRYLEHSRSGVLALSDMGGFWTAVRDGARAATLTKRSEGVDDIVARFEQLLAYGGLRLGAEIGEDVSQVLSRAHQKDPASRQLHLADTLASRGLLAGTLRIPNTAGDLDIEVDLRGQQLVLSTMLAAPEDKGPSPRVTWLLNQLNDAPDELVIESYAKNARTATAASLAELRENRLAIVPDKDHPPAKFKLVLRLPMGTARRTKRTPGFIDSVLDGIGMFYAQVLQNLASYVPPAPKIAKQAPAVDDSLKDAIRSDVSMDEDSNWRLSRVPGESDDETARQ
ncbi:MAG: stress response protein [Actinomycetota bacterium]